MKRVNTSGSSSRPPTPKRRRDQDIPLTMDLADLILDCEEQTGVQQALVLETQPELPYHLRQFQLELEAERGATICSSLHNWIQPPAPYGPEHRHSRNAVEDLMAVDRQIETIQQQIHHQPTCDYKHLLDDTLDDFLRVP
ncbi:uncharacterized protein LOC126355903 [Schistocerca gregaria]|uniref:uncharacterized protein LOC126355903 n=1 Tax=Schistocerca gregaria TaxID=7010 RepID=UPI00211E41E8|nr:uncharacterized protein LOC126355903 [Schistocerca gregaria]XP_049862372.1 uncharacterized protein LOC126355903 [Schistocerca gregaria]